MTVEEFWEEYDIIHNNKHKSIDEINKMLCESKNVVKRIKTTKSIDIDTLFIEARAHSFIIERFN
jgi:hypothetical protein